LEPALRAIVERLLEIPSPGRPDVDRIKLQVCRELGLGGIPANSEIISVLEPHEAEILLPLLRRKRPGPRAGSTSWPS